jgi:hypothetical protein
MDYGEESYRPVDPHQQFLLRPDMGEWVPDEHLVWFVLEVVGRLDTTAFHARSRLGGWVGPDTTLTCCWCC